MNGFRDRRAFTALCAGMLFLLLAGSSSIADAGTPQDSVRVGRVPRFQSAIEAFERADSANPPPKGAILFIGSSIFRRWTHLSEQMAPLPVFNRAFGGSRTAEVLHYMGRIVLPYQPSIVVYYCGSNDVNASLPPDTIADRFIQFSERVRDSLPSTLVFYVSINRAPQKRARWGSVDSTNTLVARYCAASPRRRFIDVNPLLCDEGGNPRAEMFLDDGLHLTDPAYEEFARLIKPILQEAWSGK